MVKDHCAKPHSFENRRLLVRSPVRQIFFSRINDSHCDRIHSFFTAVHCFDNSYVRKQPMAWKEYCAEYLLKGLKERMDRCTGCRDITKHHSINQSTTLFQETEIRGADGRVNGLILGRRLDHRHRRFLAPLAVGQRAYVVRCPSVRPSVRALTFSLNIFFSETTYQILMKFHRNVPAMVLFKIF